MSKMSYRIDFAVDPTIELRRVADEQLHRVLDEIDSDRLPFDEKVHQLRKRMKKLRGLLRLYRGGLGKTYKNENRCFRDVARRLSETRDARVMVETFNALMERYADDIDRRHYAPMRGVLEAREAEVIDRQNPTESLAIARDELSEAAGRAAGWTLDEEGFDVVAKGVKKTYGRGRDAVGDLMGEPDEARVHELRKRTKYHRYHCRLSRDLWPAEMNVRRKEADRLGELLGDHHDLTVLRGVLADEAERFNDADRVASVDELAQRRQAEMLIEARPMAMRLFAMKPKHLVKAWARCVGAAARRQAADDAIAALPSHDPAA